MDVKKIKLPVSARKLLVAVLGFGFAFTLAMAPLIGVKRIPHFRPLADVLLEKQQNLIMPIVGVLLSVVALIVHLYYGERLSLKRLRRSFFATLIIFLISVGALITLPWYVIEPACLEKPTVVGWSRLPSCDCKEMYPDDADCYLYNACSIAGCWSKGQVKAVELSMYASYLGTFFGFVAMAGIVVLIERTRSQSKRRARQPSRNKPNRIPPDPAAVEPPQTT